MDTFDKSHILTPASRPTTCSPDPRRSGELRLAGKKILLIEDTPDARMLFFRIITRAGAEIIATESVAEARRWLVNFQPDVIVSDIGLPGEDGMSFMRHYRDREPELDRTPAIALTAFAQLREPVLGAGFDLFLTKPITGQELIAGILQVLAQPIH